MNVDYFNAIAKATPKNHLLVYDEMLRQTCKICPNCGNKLTWNYLPAISICNNCGQVIQKEE